MTHLTDSIRLANAHADLLRSRRRDRWYAVLLNVLGITLVLSVPFVAMSDGSQNVALARFAPSAPHTVAAPYVAPRVEAPVPKPVVKVAVVKKPLPTKVETSVATNVDVAKRCKGVPFCPLQ